MLVHQLGPAGKLFGHTSCLAWLITLYSPATPADLNKTVPYTGQNL